MLSHEIHKQLASLNIFLNEFGSYYFFASDLNKYKEEVASLTEILEKPGEVLYIGILGGTGVGKSTLINAIAQNDVSGIGHRRPFTDRAVVFRHEHTPRGLDHLSRFLRPEDATHTIEIARNLIILDLPDFDAHEEANRETVLQILPSLDAVIWLVTPEKYANETFYSFVRDTRINSENFTFVLNKSDELLDGHGETNETHLTAVLGSFTGHLREWGKIAEPRVFLISAASEFEQTHVSSFLDSEFHRLRQFLIRKRDEKEIAAIKTENLIDRTKNLLSEIKSAIDIDAKKRFVHDLHLVFQEGNTEVPEFELKRLERRLSEIIFPEVLASDGSIGILKTAIQLKQRVKSLFSRNQVHSPSEIIGEIVSLYGESFGVKCNSSLARIDTEISFHLSGDSAKIPQPAEEYSLISSKNKALFALNTSLTVLRSDNRVWKLRRTLQRFWLFIPFLVLCIRLVQISSGPGSTDSNLWYYLKMVATIPLSLYASDGIIAIIAFFVFEIIVLSMLASRRLKKLTSVSSQISAQIVQFIERDMKQIYETLLQEKRELVGKLENSLTLLDSIKIK